MRHFIQYWKSYDPDSTRGSTLDFAASAYFKKRAAGDTVWIVALRARRLTLLGRLVVGRVVPRQEAVRQLGERVYDAPFVVLAESDTEQKIVETDIQHLAFRLRFKSARDRLSRDKPLGMQLQNVRELTPETSELLQSALNCGRQHADGELGEVAAIAQEQAAGFQSNVAIRQAVESFAMSAAHSILVARGYKNLTDTSRSKPYDYTCERNGKTYFVEVKGTQTAGDMLILTKGEVDHINSHREECILVLTRSVIVLGKNGVEVTGGKTEVQESWQLRRSDLTPIQFAWKFRRALRADPPRD